MSFLCASIMKKKTHLIWIVPCLILMSYYAIDQTYKSNIANLEPVPIPQKYLTFKKHREYNPQSPAQRLESTILHDFKSIYIQDRKVYDINTTLKAPGKRKTKIISINRIGPIWFRKFPPFAYHRDFKACPYSECYFDATGRLLHKAAVVLFFIVKYTDNKPERRPGQIWLDYAWESPMSSKSLANEYYYLWKDVFNWTAGFSVDNDFFWPHAYLGWRAKEDLLSDTEYSYFAKKKTKTAVWWTSHCYTQSRRLAYVREMQKYVDIDIYGKCTDLQCWGWESCASMLNDTYKFYLAFENAFCKDYVTEKFFRCFQDRRFVVPVVRGGFEYEKYFPPGTFINANDFKNAKELALYLKALANDIPMYTKFLKEKDKLTTLEHRIDWCEICERLHTEDNQKTIPDINSITLNKSRCWQVDDIK